MSKGAVRKAEDEGRRGRRGRKRSKDEEARRGRKWLNGEGGRDRLR